MMLQRYEKIFIIAFFYEQSDIVMLSFVSEHPFHTHTTSE